MTGQPNQIDQYRSRLRDALGLINDLKARLDAVERAAHEPIAVIGRGCRFPGGGEGPEAFWRVLEGGVDAVREVSPARWPANATAAGRQEGRWAALLDDVATFDAAFFGISPREAESLDPQQRMLLEVTWEALEDAGQRTDALIGTQTGVFIGISSNDYKNLVAESRADHFDAYCGTGSAFFTAAGRISFVFGFQGPAISMDTACSSSLVAISQACQSLRAGDANLAIVGGVNAILFPELTRFLLEMQALSVDGRCKTLDARANGYVRGEGCGVVILKRLSDALRDGDRIRGVIPGWAINQDGRSTGLTAPNVLSQQAMLRQALERARITAADIDYIEMHGTGTPLGDPIEAEALIEVLGAPRTDGSKCVLGAVKTNIGHLEGGAGIAGFIKVLLSFEHDRIPRNLHFRTLNPRISFNGTPFVVPVETTPWPRKDKPRRAGISSFGISGTNAHIIVQEPPPAAVTTPRETRPYLLPLSAKSAQALSAMAKSYAEWFSTTNESPLHDIIFTASLRRTHLEHRLAVVAQTAEEFAHLLDAFARGEEPAAVKQARLSPQDLPPVLFVFSGQGSQWAGMGKTLLEHEPTFRAHVERIDALVQLHAKFSVLEELQKPEGLSLLDATEIAQPAIFALQTGLFELFKSWGITPNAVIGHSVGEVSAAYASGALSLEDAVRLIVLRGRILQKSTGLGKMVWVAMPAVEAQQVIAGFENTVSIAAVNDPSSVVLSGENHALDGLIATLEKRGIATRPLRVNYAFHSPQMDPLAQELVTSLQRLVTQSTNIRMYSTVTGALVDGPSLDVAYWGRNVRATVNLAKAVQTALDDGVRALVEMGAHPVLLTNLEQCAAEKNIDVSLAPTLRRNGDASRALLETLGALHVVGTGIDWKRLLRDEGRVVSLPPYPWQRQRYWVDPPKKQKERPSERSDHPLLGNRLALAGQSNRITWEQRLSLEAFAYLEDHRVQGEVIFPGAGYVEMAIAAANLVHGENKAVVEELVFEQMLALSPGDERILQLSLHQDDPDRAAVTISSTPAGTSTWVQHARGTVRWESNPPNPATFGQLPPRPIDATILDSSEHYTRFGKRGLTYGPTFRAVQEVTLSEHEALVRLSLPSEIPSAGDYHLHPAFLDACFQGASWAVQGVNGNDTVIPISVANMRLYQRPGRELWIFARALPNANEKNRALSVLACNENGETVFEVGTLRAEALEQNRSAAADPYAQCIFDVAWRKIDLPAKSWPAPRESVAWLIVLDEHGLGAALTEKLRSHGERVVTASIGREFKRFGEDAYQLDATNVEQWNDLIATRFGKRGCRGVIDCGALDGAAWNQTTTATLGADLRRGTLAALRLAQALLKPGWRDVPRLYVLTRAAQAVGMTSPTLSVAQSTLWGLARVIAIELPDLECTCIDLPQEGSPDEPDLILRELAHASEEDQIALRPDGRYGARLVHSSWGKNAAPDAPRIHADGTYLIAGGLGGLGLSLAKWMVGEGAKHLVLLGRNAPNASAEVAMHDMQSAGADVRALRADIARRGDVDAILEHIEKDMPPLRGIVHAAAVLADRTLVEMNEAEFFRAIEPKVFGAWNLHEATQTRPLDFFIMYSSAASLLGSPGQANYAAANAFLDALGHTRTALGLAGTSIQWGPFADVGLAVANDVRGKRLASRGSASFSSEDGNLLFARVLARPRPSVGLTHLEARQWVEFYPQMAGTPFLTELLRETGAPERPGKRRLQDELEHLTPPQRILKIELHLLDHLSRVLRIEADKIDKRTPFTNLGMDSLMSMELRNRLEASLGFKLPAALLFTYSTTTALTNHLAERILQDLPLVPQPQPVAEPVPSQRAAMVESADHAVEDIDEAALIDKLADFEEYLNE